MRLVRRSGQRATFRDRKCLKTPKDSHFALNLRYDILGISYSLTNFADKKRTIYLFNINKNFKNGKSCY